MISRLLLALVVAATFGLSACGKTEEPAAEKTAPETGAVEQGSAAAEKKGGEKASE